MALCYSNSSLNPFTPELPVSARADPRSFYHLWRHQFYWSRTTLSVSVCRVRRSFKHIPEWAQFSQGYRRKRQKNMWDWPENCHENLVPLPAYLSFHLTQDPKSFPKTFSHQNEAYSMPRKKIEARKGKKEGGEEVKCKSQDCACRIFASYSKSLHLDQKSERCQPVNGSL